MDTLTLCLNCLHLQSTAITFDHIIVVSKYYIHSLNKLDFVHKTHNIILNPYKLITVSMPGPTYTKPSYHTKVFFCFLGGLVNNTKICMIK